MAKNIVHGYYDESYTPMPTKATRFWRRNILWQAFRFVVLNIRIVRIIVGGHT